MQFLAVILALAATAVAAPNGDSSDSWKCTFGEYACDKGGDSIKQCSIDGKWVVSRKYYHLVHVFLLLLLLHQAVCSFSYHITHH